MADTKLPHPWDSPGKNTGVGCHFLLQCMKVKSESEVTQSCPTLIDPMDCSLPAPPPMGFSRQEYWSGVQLPSLSHLAALIKYILRLHSWMNKWKRKHIRTLTNNKISPLNDGVDGIRLRNENFYYFSCWTVMMFSLIEFEMTSYTETKFWASKTCAPYLF